MFVSAFLLNALACVVSFEIQAAYGEVDAGCVQLGQLKCTSTSHTHIHPHTHTLHSARGLDVVVPDFKFHVSYV